jgi:hypothetical protein
VLLEPEIEPVMHSLEESGFEVTALHNHLRNESPHIMYLHYLGVGDATKLAAALKAALGQSKTPLQAPPAPSAPAAFSAEDTIERALGFKGSAAGGVLAIGAARVESLTLRGMSVPPAMGVGVVMNFQDIGQGRVATTGDFPLIAMEVPIVEKVLRSHGFDLTALHHHMLGDSPALYYMHFWKVGPASDVAAGLKDALNQINVRVP